MRKILNGCKAFAVIALSLGAFVFALLLYRAPVFEKGEGYELYFGNSSSAKCVRTEHPAALKLQYNIKGESVRYAGDRYEEIKKQFNATLLFTERVDGVTNYYLYSPRLGDTVQLSGYPVNLHVAVSTEQTAAGTPLIFGGF